TNRTRNAARRVAREDIRRSGVTRPRTSRRSGLRPRWIARCLDRRAQAVRSIRSCHLGSRKANKGGCTRDDAACEADADSALDDAEPVPEAAAYSPRFVQPQNDPSPLAELGLRAPPYSADHEG